MIENLTEIDHILFKMINQGLSNEVFDFIMPAIRNKLTWIPLYAVFIFILFKQFGIKAVYIVALAICTVVITDQLSSQVIKKTVKRDRPCKVFTQPSQINLLIPCRHGYSFTSSHATNHFGIAMFFALIWARKRWAGLLMLWAAIVSFAQVYVGVHFPFDVLAGGLLGICVGIIFGMIGNHIIKKYICNLTQKA